MSYKIGDKVWVTFPSNHYRVKGGGTFAGTVMGYAEIKVFEVPVPAWGVDVPETMTLGGKSTWNCLEWNLKPRDDPSEIGSWDDCVWRPHDVGVCA